MGSKNKQTEKSRYLSRYAPDTYITIQQYILELICERQANFQKKQLPLYFWKNDDWASIYKRWLRVTHKLSKEYSAEAILHALQDIRAKYRWSLNTEFMKGLILEHQIKIEKQKELISQSSPIEVTTGDSFRESGVENNKLKKLLELD